MAMTPEEYERLKEAEKEHLRKMRKLKQAVRDLERQKTVTRAVQNITDEPRRIMDEQEQLIDQIAMEAAQSEARLEIALEAAGEKEVAQTAKVSDAEAEAVLKQARARELVRQLRESQQGASGGSQSATQPATASGQKAPSDDRTGSPENGEEDDDAPPSMPEKTIGRMKP